MGNAQMRLAEFLRQEAGLKKTPSGLPAISPTRGENTCRQGSRLQRCASFPVTPPTVKPLPLVGRGWGGETSGSVGEGETCWEKERKLSMTGQEGIFVVGWQRFRPDRPDPSLPRTLRPLSAQAALPPMEFLNAPSVFGNQVR